MSVVEQVLWKDEDEVAGEPVGPTIVVREDGTYEERGWQTLRQARFIARQHGVEVREQ